MLGFAESEMKPLKRLETCMNKQQGREQKMGLGAKRGEGMCGFGWGAAQAGGKIRAEGH